MKAKMALVLATFLAAGLAGCSDRGGAQDDEPTDELGLEATDETGIIRGVVFDEAVVPLEGVEIGLTVPGAPAMATYSLANGAFGFEGLDPGVYFVTASLAGYVAVQEDVEVRAGDDSPPLVRLMLSRDPNVADPYAFTHQFEGFLECSTPALAICEGVRLVSEDIGANVTAEASQITYHLDSMPMWVQSELVWEPTNALGQRLALLYSWDCGDIYLCDHWVAGTSPLLLQANGTKLAEILGTGLELYIRVFSEGVEETGGLAGATLEQDIVIYTTIFYGYVPPEGWRFSEEQAEPLPPV